MSKEEVQQSLEALQSELGDWKGADDEVRQQLSELIDTIQQKLDASENGEEETSSSDGVSSLVEQFEVEHPRITELLNRIMTILGESGI